MISKEYSSNFTVVHNDSHVFDQFCTTMPEGPLVWGIIAMPSACVGVPASLWLLRVLIQKHRSGLTNNVYMMNLTIMDLLFNLCMIPHILNRVIWHNMDIFNVCRHMFSLSSCGRPLLMACMCVDSYVAVVHPIIYMRIKNMRYRTVLSLLVWGLVLLNSIPQASMSIVSILLGVTIPVIVFSNVSVLRALNKPDPSGRTDVHSQKQRALQIIVNSFLVSIVSYPALMIGYVTLALQRNQYLFCYVFMPSTIPSSLGSSIMPLFYLRNLVKMKTWLISCQIQREEMSDRTGN